ncbi:MAG: PIN/TRAM domain-containing protein [Planctomycetaceae bacterium]|jgi:uncharacterized protein YacL|nr:PIN/TRAM domain-containing protein [Planctomycetaceae bacterium]
MPFSNNAVSGGQFVPNNNLNLTNNLTMGLVILRSVFILVASGIGVYMLTINSQNPHVEEQYTLWTFYSVLLIAAALVIFDMLLPKKRVDWISSIYFGILIGLFLTLISGYALMPFFTVYGDPQMQSNAMLVIGMSLCYICTSFLFQTKDDFRFIIPYVEFRRNVKGLRTMIVDTSALIDGRICDIADTHIIDNPLVVPKFVVEELHAIASSGDRGRRMRGRRGLDVLTRLQTSKNIEVTIETSDLQEYSDQTDEMKLLILAKYLEGKIITNEYNLTKMAKVQMVETVNLNDLATVMKPVFLPGEKINITVAKLGEDPAQGVGYLEDGTMVVIEDGRDYVSQRVVMMVTSVLQTAAGRLIFGAVKFPTKRPPYYAAYEKEDKKEDKRPPSYRSPVPPARR